jgi:hypothetical protein
MDKVIYSLFLRRTVMLVRSTRLAGVLLTTVLSLPAFAWQVSLDSKQIKVSNDRQLRNVDVYLVWFDMDAKEEQSKFQSWTENGWQPDLVPALEAVDELAPFEALPITSLEPSCPEQHRCNLALVALAHKQHPLAKEAKWLATSILPLNQMAACDRFPGQAFFLTCGAETNANRNEVALDGGTTEMAPETAADTSKTAGTTTTEKPDILRLAGDKLLYANNQAQRFQVIDIADVSKPQLASWMTLPGNPRELYVLGNYYILLQTDYAGEQGTHLTVLATSDDGQLKSVQEYKLAGQFLESRRRDEVIYTITQDYSPVTTDATMTECIGCFISQEKLTINAFRFNYTNGNLEEVKSATIPGYYPRTAIFPDYLLVANHNPTEQNWLTTQIQVFDLSKDNDPLVALPMVKVPGQVPSEFHLDVKGSHLRVVYGPENREAGSTLAIYDLTSPTMASIGEIGKIAPGEDLFATRFVEDRAFVVTYERKDPLWIIDLSDPTAPKIAGELEVPGWSEKMFFHNNRLFAVGIDDQPQEGETWVRRVAVSLFDVTDPTHPTLLDRLIPLAGKVNYSSSPALEDERALLLNWDEAFAALPVDSWESNTSNHLQIVSFAKDKFEDAGRLDVSVSLQRSLTIAPSQLAAIGDQELFTLQWGQGQTQILGQLELATNLAWLTSYNDQLLAAVMGSNGYYRIHRYTTSNLDTPIQRWDFPKGSYGSLKQDGDLIVFYQYDLLNTQVLNVSTGEVYQVALIENPQNDATTSSNVSKPEPAADNTEASSDAAPKKPENGETTESSATNEEKPAIMPEIILYQRTEPLIHNGWFYIAEQKSFYGSTGIVAPQTDNQQLQWLLRSWNLRDKNAKEAPTRSIPGQPFAFTNQDELITYEATAKGQLRLNKVALAETDSVNLLESRELPCRSYSPMRLAGEAIYLNCITEDRYYGPIYLDDVVDVAATDDTANKDEEQPVKEQPEPTTQLLKLSINQGFMEESDWTLKGWWSVSNAIDDIVWLSPNGGWRYYYPMMGGVMVKAGIRAPTDDVANYCGIYRLTADKEPQLLKQLDTYWCPSPETTAMSNNQAWMAEGFAGIKTITW